MAGGGRAHVYELTWPAPGDGGALGACHGLDIPLLFGTYGADLGLLLFAGAEPSAEALALSARFRASWTAFARTGDPGWPAYDDAERRLVQVLDAEPEVRAYPEEAVAAAVGGARVPAAAAAVSPGRYRLPIGSMSTFTGVPQTRSTS